MQGDPILMLAWIAAFGVFIVNLIAAGCAALFHIWSGDSTPGVRMLAGAAMGGFIPAILLGGLVMIGAGTPGTMNAWIVMAPVFLFDLVGLPAVSDTGEALGNVVAVENFGAGDIVEIERPTGKRFMVPMRPEAVPEWSAERLVVSEGYAED